MSASFAHVVSFARRLLSNPFIVWFIGNMIAALAAGFTGPQSILRPVGFIIVSLIAWYAVSTFPARYTTTGTIGRCICGSFAGMPLVYFDRLIVRKWVFGDGQTYFDKSLNEKPKDKEPSREDGKAEEGKPSFGTRFVYGLKIGESMRGIDLPWQVKNIPPYSTRDPKYVPTHYEFLARKFLIAVVCWVSHDLFIDVQLKLNRALMLPPYVPFLTRIGHVSKEEVFIRLVSSISYWIVQYSMLQFLVALGAILKVSQIPESLMLWPPFFGSFSDAYTLRDFWGNTWHQSLRATLSGPADFMVHSILHLPPKTLVARYTNIFFTFFFSGVLHAGSDKAVNLPSEGAMYFFCAQALGIMIEDGIQEMYRRVRGIKKSGRESPIWAKIIGYTWVILFLSWSTPAWIYPIIVQTKREDALLRFSSLSYLVF